MILPVTTVPRGKTLVVMVVVMGLLDRRARGSKKKKSPTGRAFILDSILRS
jgi:hypothetical protein